MKLIDVKINERVLIGDSIVVCVTKILSDHGRAKRVLIGVEPHTHQHFACGCG